ncbi:heavy-metal-associated domain-containing protein [Chitinimonas taiwanensis]|uniref:heavy-metal-associated domain-containing protein n=1 Tax=Chitinimonas taiwanensis TaxID=240412 RepID=UPI00160B4D43
MEQVFQIEGMSCGGCVASVERALRAQAGVQQVAVSLADKQAKVAFDAAQMDVARLRAAIEAAGFEVVG